MSGYVVASFSEGAFVLLLLGLGIIAGSGIGFCYVCTLSVSMKWFPGRKGLVTGVTVAGFGGGAILLSSAAELLLSGGMDVLVFFRWFGLCSGLLLFGAASLLADPLDTQPVLNRSFRNSAVFTMPFAILFTGMSVGTFAGLLIIANLTPLLMNTGLSEGMATVGVSVFAVGNAAGRIIWGQVFDRIEYKSIALSLGTLAVTAGLLLIPMPPWSHIATSGLLGFGFGANFVIYASAISRFFGVDSFPWLYPFCFLAYGIAGILGPGMGGVLMDITGSYTPSLTICILLAASAGIFSAAKLNLFEKEKFQHQ